MKEKILKSDGTIKINGEEIEVSNLDIERKNPEVKPTQEFIQKARENFNQNPVSKATNTIAVDKDNHIEKKTYLFWRILAISLLVILTIGVILANFNFNKLLNKDLKPEIITNTNISINPAQINVSIIVPINNSQTNNIYNNVSVIFDKSFLQGILNLLNITNLTIE